MAKAIYVSNDEIETTVENFRKSLIKMGKYYELPHFNFKSFAKAPTYEGARATLIFTAKAYSKMMALVAHFEGEVGWYGLCSRINKTNFLVDDILNFKQTVDGTNVNTDPEDQIKFWDELDDESSMKLKLYGHSHVLMGVTPSAVDMDNRLGVLRNTPKATADYDEFRIFLIWNKHSKRNIQIFDLTNNIQYDDEDIDVSVMFEDGSFLEDFLEEAKELVQPKKYTYVSPAVTTVSNGYYGKSYHTHNTFQNDKTKQGGTSNVSNPTYAGMYSHFNDEDDIEYDDDFYDDGFDSYGRWIGNKTKGAYNKK